MADGTFQTASCAFTFSVYLMVFLFGKYPRNISLLHLFRIETVSLTTIMHPQIARNTAILNSCLESVLSILYTKRPLDSLWSVMR